MPISKLNMTVDARITEEQEAKRQLEEILRVCTRCQSVEDHKLIYKAFEVAMAAHTGVRRKSGELYIMHQIGRASCRERV